MADPRLMAHRDTLTRRQTLARKRLPKSVDRKRELALRRAQNHGRTY